MVPYKSLLGYKKGEDGSLVIDDTQAPTVRLIYQLFLDGMAISEIKTELAERKILTPRGKTMWSTSTVRSILSNEKIQRRRAAAKDVHDRFSNQTHEGQRG